MEKTFRFPKKERLTHKEELDRLYRSGTVFFAYPVKFIIRPVEKEIGIPLVKVAFSVPKKSIKKAVERNLLRRRMKEGYRQNKALLSDDPAMPEHPVQIMMIYIEKVILDYTAIERGIQKGLKQVKKRMQAHKNERSAFSGGTK
ncbi:MAG TPA: ribonuclease P protein component [Prolixibacteraceae bacterium]|nr:ribonuclease P protein component [Prolixibacteraceae bacterium]